MDIMRSLLGMVVLLAIELFNRIVVASLAQYAMTLH